MVYAIVEIQGQQFKVLENKWILVPLLEKLNNSDAATLEKKRDQLLFFDKVLFLKNEKEAYFGTPYLKDVKIEAKVMEPLIKGDKISVFKYKRSKRYRRKYGHRTSYTKLKIEKISFKEA